MWKSFNFKIGWFKMYKWGLRTCKKRTCFWLAVMHMLISNQISNWLPLVKPVDATIIGALVWGIQFQLILFRHCVMFRYSIVQCALNVFWIQWEPCFGYHFVSSLVIFFSFKYGAVSWCGNVFFKFINNSWENKGNHHREGGLDLWS